MDQFALAGQISTFLVKNMDLLEQQKSVQVSTFLVKNMDEMISFRADKKVAKELAEVQKYEYVDRSTAARKVFELGIAEWKKQEAIKLIVEGKISLGKAAKMLGIPLYQIIELLKQRKVTFISMTEQEIEREFGAAKRH